MNTFTLVVCSYNRISLLLETIESILLHCQHKANFELLIVDNNSTDNTADAIKPLLTNPRVRYVLETRQGLSIARNRGVAEAKHPIVVMLDDDIDLHPKYMDTLEHIYSDPAVAIAGGKVLPYKEKIPDWLPEKYNYLVSLYDAGEKPLYVQKLLGANFSFRKKVWEEVGDFDAQFGPNAEFKLGGDENDFLQRAQQKGYQVLYHPDLVVYHKIANRFNKAFVLKYAFNVGASEATIDFVHRRMRLRLKQMAFMAKSVLSKLTFLRGSNDDFVQSIEREKVKGYLARANNLAATAINLVKK
jgi:glycosyltransferase involved in cell wall biosynthesis